MMWEHARSEFLHLFFPISPRLTWHFYFSSRISCRLKKVEEAISKGEMGIIIVFLPNFLQFQLDLLTKMCFDRILLLSSNRDPNERSSEMIKMSECSNIRFHLISCTCGSEV